MHRLLEVDPKLTKPRLWLAVGVGLLLLIVYMSLVPTPVIPMPGNTDKLYHGSAYAVLMGWWLQLFRHRLTHVLLALAFIAVGVGIEYLQSFQPLRYFDVADMLANTTGVLISWALGWTAFDRLLYRFERRVWPG